MTLIISTTINPVGAPILDTPERLAELAGEHAGFSAGAGTVVAITIPAITSDQRQLAYHTRNSNSEFMFNTGTLRLSLRQEIHVSNALNVCSQTAWIQHEQHHVADNERVMAHMETALRNHVEIQEILIRPRWQNISLFQSTQQTIQEVVGEVFLSLTEAAVRHLDTRAEYQRVERQIRVRCGHAVARRLARGSYGQGVDLVQLALNNHPPTVLAPLNVDGIFGRITEERVKEFQRNNDLTDDGIVGSLTRTALGI